MKNTLTVARFRRAVSLRSALTALLLAPLATLFAAEVPQATSTHRILFRQPEQAGFGDRMYVQARVPLGDFAMVGWQKSPYTPDGKFLPVGWDAGVKTGLAVTGDRTLAQRGMRDVAGATTAQMSGDAVGAYLNSADLSGCGSMRRAGRFRGRTASN